MDYSRHIAQNIAASEAADLAYAKWYYQLPDEKKAQIIQSGYDLVANKIRFEVLQENPFATEAEIIFRFIEVTQKKKYPPKTWAFIEQKMKERIAKEWQERFKAMKKELGWSYEDLATFMGAANGGTVKASINRQLPAFAKLVVCVFEQMKKQV